MPNVSVAATLIEAEIARYLATHPEEPDPARHVAAEYRILPLFSDFMGCWALATDGQIVFVAWDDPSRLEPVSESAVDRGGLHAALAFGSKRYPALAAIQPERTADAVPCTTCDGSGRKASWPSNVFCACGGLGWTPPA